MSSSSFSSAAKSSVAVRHLVLQVEPPTESELGVVKFHDWSIKEQTVFEYSLIIDIVKKLPQFIGVFKRIEVLSVIGNIPEEIATIILESGVCIDEVDFCGATITWSPETFLDFIEKCNTIVADKTIFGPGIFCDKVMPSIIEKVLYRTEIIIQEPTFLSDVFLENLMLSENTPLSMNLQRIPNVFTAATVIRTIMFAFNRNCSQLIWDLGIMKWEQEAEMRQFASKIQTSQDSAIEAGRANEPDKSDQERFRFGTSRGIVYVSFPALPQ